ncbi:hypothetical protein HK101_009062 [Irineochytrium annulatum]|nr:hypothetical protein HK101_009062 [Irineochytrium annulatum]
MTYESALRYTEESVKQCKELANFLKKRQQAEHDYARTLVKLSQKPPGMANLSPSFYRSPAGSTTNLNSTNPSEKPELSKAHLMKSSLWKGYGEIVDETSKLAEAHQEMAMSMQQDVIDPFTNYIREMEVVRKAQIEKGQEFLKNLHDAYSGLKKVKKEYEALQASSAEAINNHVRAQQNPATKDREMEKLTIKMQGAVEKAKKAEDTMKWWDEMFATAKEDYFGTFLPGLYEDIRVKEEERCIAVKRALRDFVHLQKAHSSNYNRVMEFLSERVSGIDISEDSEDFVSTHMVDEQRGAIHDVPARNHVSPIIKGRLHLKRGDLVSGWKPKLFILTNDKLLYCYDSDESQRPRDIIGLRAASVSSVDDSFFNKPFCLQVINVTASGRQVYNLSADSESTRDEWLMNLKDHAYCCSKCASGYGYNPDIGSNMHLLDRVNGFRLIRSLELGIMEAKDLPGTLVSGGARGLSPFGVIMFDEVKQARTSTKSGDTPFWGENFFFDDIRPHHNRVRILMFHQNRIQRDTDIGYISIHLDQVKTSKRVEEWFKIKPIPKAGMDENMSGGSIRIAFTFKEDTLLPSVEYDNFLVLVTDPSLHALKFLGRVVTAQREALAKSALRVFTCVSREIEVVSALVEADIAATDDPNILFRGNTLGTKILDQYMKQVGMEYLHATIGGHVRGIMKGKESCELDPLRVEQGVVDADRRNAKRLVSYVSGIWEAIVKSIEHCPSELLVIFSHIRTIVVQKWGPASDTSKYTGISGFIFLRFFCPAILSPKLFNITTEMPNSTSARTLTLIAKILQNLANLTEFGLKEPYMVQCNVFIQEQILNMKAFIDRISTPAEHPNAILTPKPRLDIRRETETLYQIFADHLNEMSNANSTREADSIISVTRELSNLHKSYDAEDGSAASSAVSTDPRGYPGAVPLKPGVVPPRSNQTPGFSATYMMGNQSNSDFPGLGTHRAHELVFDFVVGSCFLHYI